MAASVNKVILVGHLGRDPEIRHTQSGTAIATLSIATSDSWKDKASDERKEKTEWHRVVIFNEKLVEVVEKYLKKGAAIYVEGKLRHRKYEKDGVDMYTTEVVLENYKGELHMLGGKRDEPPPAGSPDDYGQAGKPDKATKQTRDLDDEVPF